MEMEVNFHAASVIAGHIGESSESITITFKMKAPAEQSNKDKLFIFYLIYSIFLLIYFFCTNTKAEVRFLCCSVN